MNYSRDHQPQRSSSNITSSRVHLHLHPLALDCARPRVAGLSSPPFPVFYAAIQLHPYPKPCDDAANQLLRVLDDCPSVPVPPSDHASSVSPETQSVDSLTMRAGGVIRTFGCRLWICRVSQVNKLPWSAYLCPRPQRAHARSAHEHYLCTRIP